MAGDTSSVRLAPSSQIVPPRCSYRESPAPASRISPGIGYRLPFCLPWFWKSGDDANLSRLGKPHHRRELARLGSVQSGFKGRKELDAPERDVAKGRTRWRSAKLTGESSKWWLSLSQSHAPASRTARRLRISPPHRGGGAQLNRSASAFAIARPCGFSIRHMERGATGSILGHSSSFTIC
jgi:hypothetical protein